MIPDEDDTRPDKAVKRRLRERIGPGLITAALVLGPGSIVAASRAGADTEYRLVWLLALACLFMATFSAMGARLGCVLRETPIQYLARRWGRPLALLAGLAAFLVTAGFQFGNNIGIAVAMSGLTGLPTWLWPPLFTVLSLVFLIAARNVYQWLERVMIILVAIMALSFAANLVRVGIRPVSFARGFVPGALSSQHILLGSALLATTFSAVAAFYQAYLVREKGWTRETLRTAISDAWLGIAILGGMTLVILMGAARTLHGKSHSFENVGQLAGQLRGLLGPLAMVVFSCGLAAASFSSFIANAFIGGALLSDGLGRDPTTSSTWTRVLTASIMLIGCVVAVAVLQLGIGGATSLLLAQSSTLLAAPLCALLLFGLTSSRGIMGGLRNRWPSMLLGVIGLCVLVVLSMRTFSQVAQTFAELL